MPRLAFAVVIMPAFIGLAAMAAHARQASDAERQMLATTIASFDAAMRKKDYADVIRLSLPPRMINLISSKAGVAADVLIKQVVAMTAQTMGSVKLESFGMDLPGARYLETASGVPYALVPTSTVIAVNAKQNAVARSNTLAILEDGKWFLIRIGEQQQIDLLREAYPDFAGIELKKGTMELISK